jgi:subtilisin family serine protease
VAPNSAVHLIRVLNEYGCGDLWSLNNALNTFIGQQAVNNTLDKVVLNLSLGVHQPRDVSELDWPEEIVTLDETLRNAHAMGAVIVAASGNDSYPTMVAGPMQLPAAWPYVVGVAATNPARDRSCYSNEGHVAAPGGDGGPWKGKPCQPVADQCADDEAGCNVGVVSLATQPAPGYRFWVGTSFAAPLVSGQAALLLSNGLPGPDVKPCILASAADSAGVSIIDIAASTGPRVVEQCQPD